MVDYIQLTWDGDRWWTLADMVMDFLVPQNTSNLVSWMIINTFPQFCCMELRVLWGILQGVKPASYSWAHKIVLLWHIMSISDRNCNKNPSHPKLKLCTSWMGISTLQNIRVYVLLSNFLNISMIRKWFYQTLNVWKQNH